MSKLFWLKHLFKHYGIIGSGPLLIFISVLLFIAFKDKPWLKKNLKKYHNKTIWIALGLIAIICCIVFKDYLLLRNSYLFWDINDDGYVEFYPKLYNISHYIANYGLPKWSFRMGMGQNIFPFMLLDPFDIIVYLTGKNNIPSLFIYIEVLKIILGGGLFFSYLKLLDFSDYTSITGCLLFSFCSYFTVGSPFMLFSFEAFNFALFLFAFEMLYSKQKWGIFPVAVCLACISFPFDLYLYCLFIALYAAFRHLQSEKNNIAKLGVLYIKMLGLGVLGILLAGSFVLENVMQLLNTPRGSGLTSYTHQLASSPVFGLADNLQLGTSIMRFFSNDILGSNSNFKGWFNYVEAPMFYCGLPCLLLLPQVFLFLSKKIRVVFILFISLWLVPIIFPYFRYAFWLFAGDYYRVYSLFISVLFMYYSFYALEYIFQKRKISRSVLLITSVILIILLCCPPFIKEHIINNRIRVFAITTLIIYTILLMCVGKVKDITYIKFAFFITIIFELCYSVNVTVNERSFYTMQAFKNKAKIPYHDYSYNDYSLDAVKYIQSRDPTFYRIDRSCDSSDILNSSQIQGYNGTSAYSSFNQLYYVKYLQLMGIIDKNNEASSRWIQGLSNIPILELENSVKYFLLSKNDTTRLSPVIWDPIAITGDVRIFKNKLLLPFGFTYCQFIKESDFKFASPRQKEFITLKAIVINDKDADKVGRIKEYQLKDTITGAFDPVTYGNDLKNLRIDTLTMTKFDDNHLSGKIAANEDKVMYLSIPYDDSWQLKVDGEKQEKILVNGGMTGILLKKGTHTVEMHYILRFWTIGLLMSILAIFIYAGLWYAKRKNRSQVSTQ